jgi:ABC-type transporter Mla subunit MlaD
LLLLAGRHRSGTVAAVSGAALTLLNQQDTLSSWWHSLPNYIDEVQRVLTQVQDAVNDVAAKRETLRRILAR